MLSIDGFEIEGNYPTIISSKQKLDYPDFINLISSQKEAIKNLLLKKGGLIFRGFPVTSAMEFANVVETLQLGNFVNYIAGDSPRDKVEAKVYTSTEAPPSMHIPLHQELSFIKNHPRHIYFYCDVAPQEFGETIIGDARKIYHAIDPEVRTRFETKSLLYTSNYYGDSKIMKLLNRWQRSHKSWAEVFETTERQEVEKRCLHNEIQWQWNKNGWLQISQLRPATLTHPVTQEKVWFNQAHLYDFNPRLLGWSNYVLAKLFYIRKTMRLHEIAHADGSTVRKKDLYHLMDVLQQNTVATPWQKGDVMVLDNILSMHGRAPFSGPRRVLTAMTA